MSLILGLELKPGAKQGAECNESPLEELCVCLQGNAHLLGLPNTRCTPMTRTYVGFFCHRVWVKSIVLILEMYHHHSFGNLWSPQKLILCITACQTRFLFLFRVLPLCFRCSSLSWHRWSTEMPIWQRWQPWGPVRGNLWRHPAQGPSRYLHVSIQPPFCVELSCVLFTKCVRDNHSHT